MVNRTTFSGASAPPLTGVNFLNQYAERLDTLFDASALPLTGVAGTANAVTASLDPPLAIPGSFVDGMKFTVTWAAANTAGVTLAINGGAALAVLDAGGTALPPDALTAGLRSLIEFVGGAFRVLSSLSGGGTGMGRFYQAFTAGGTWTKPAGLDPDTMVMVQAWGAGGGGETNGQGGGGGGAGYAVGWFRLGDLPSTVTVTVPAGGAVNTAGGNATFGAFLTAYGGGRPGTGSAGGGGGGGGELAVGGNGNTTTGGAGGSVTGGAGASSTSGARGGAGLNFGGGGGGSGDAVSGRNNGGNAVWGGGGGAGHGTSAGTPGMSVYGGEGGLTGVAGAAPGGGGGRNAAGGRGEIRVWV